MEDSPRQQLPCPQQSGARTTGAGALSVEEAPIFIAMLSIVMPAICACSWQWAVLRRQQACGGTGARAFASGAKNPHVSANSNILAVNRDMGSQ